MTNATNATQYSWKYWVCSIAVTDLADLESNGAIPSDWKFAIKNGNTLYDEVGSSWRERSDNTVYDCEFPVTRDCAIALKVCKVCYCH